MALIEGKFAGQGGTRKYSMQWIFFNLPLVEEYGAQHRIFFKKPGNVFLPPSKCPSWKNITGPQPDEECLETELDSDLEEEEKGIVNVDEEHADSQSVEVARRIC